MGLISFLNRREELTVPSWPAESYQDIYSVGVSRHNIANPGDKGRAVHFAAEADCRELLGSTTWVADIDILSAVRENTTGSVTLRNVAFAEDVPRWSFYASERSSTDGCVPKLGFCATERASTDEY